MRLTSCCRSSVVDIDNIGHGRSNDLRGILRVLHLLHLGSVLWLHLLHLGLELRRRGHWALGLVVVGLLLRIAHRRSLLILLLRLLLLLHLGLVLGHWAAATIVGWRSTTLLLRDRTHLGSVGSGHCLSYYRRRGTD